MSSTKKKVKKEKIEIENDEKSNEIKIKKRTLENFTHEVLEDIKLKTITSWRKSKSKFLKSLIFNILTFGILHIISLYYPKLYVKLYCNPWPGKECDFFLVENIYGKFTLCTKIYRKNKNKDYSNYNLEMSNQTIRSSSTFIKKKNEYYYMKNLTYSFIYKSMIYEYNEITNEINPVYLDLSKLTNKEIRNIFGEGLTTENKVTLFRERYGKNEYYINMNLLSLYFFKVELPSLIMVLIIGAFELYLKDYFSFAFKYVIVLVIFLSEYLIIKNITSNINNKDNSIDGEINDIKVRRKYLLNDDNKFYVKIKNEDLLPGDIIFLKADDIVPCDCLIIEGECIVNGSNSTGSLETFKKISLENNNRKFNYEYNKVSILCHGMEIVNSLSKVNNGYISALCINTGANTFKANQYSNILDLGDRKKEYHEIYEYFGGKRKYIYIAIAFNYLASLLFGYFYALMFDFNLDFSNISNFIISILLRILCKSLMPMYFITNSIIILLSLYRLKKNNIICFDKSRLLNSGNIDTIFFSKTGTLCNNCFEIISYHPVYIYRQGIINLKSYTKNKSKEINYILENYYQEYYYKKQNNININYNYSSRQSLTGSKISINKVGNQYYEYIVLFLECLLSCNNLDKFGTQIFGNNIETTLFTDMKWDIKTVDFNDEKYNNNLRKSDTRLDRNKSKDFYCSQFNIVQKRRNDIFPKNYYKITESFLNTEKEKKIKFQEILSTLDSNIISEKTKNNNFNDLIEGESNSSLNHNPILDDISKFNFDSYILRIYKRFISDGSFNSGSIVYNFMKKELRFMIKGIPEYILDKCDLYSLPDNFEDIISLYRRNGLIILICATKLLNVEEYNDLNSIDYYMNDLTFCGFITLKNKLKEEIKVVIEDLKQFDINFIISSGDNVNNSISVGFDSGILENKNIFVFDKDEENNKISIRKIYYVKDEKEDKEKISNSSIDNLSKLTSKKSQNKPSYSYIKQSLKYSGSYIRSSKSKKLISRKNNSLHPNINKESKELLTPQISKLNFDSHKFNKSRIFEKRNIKNFFKSTKILIDNNNSNFQKSTDKEDFINRSPLHQSNLEIVKKDEKNKRIKSRLSSVDPLSFNENFRDSNINQIKRNKQFNINEEGNTTTRNYFINEQRKKSLKNIYQRFYYYPGIFNENEELNDNCIYCISGKLFNFLYKNKNKREFKFLLEKIHKNCKIFYHMSSIDKSLSIDYYSEYPNSYICKIGESHSDFDPIMTSNVGINLRAPKNVNSTLCHFYTADNSIKCIKKIILEGQIIYENIFLLSIISIFCSIIINSYILTCFIRRIDVIIGQLNVLEVSFLILAVTAFTGKPEINIESNPFIRNPKLFKIHNIVQLSGFFILKLFSVYLSSKKYRTNRLLDISKVDKIFTTYYFILCIELIFSTCVIIKNISFYRKNILSNTFFMLSIILLLSYFVMLVTLNSSNLRVDIFNISYFEYYEYIIDSFDDRNKIKYIIFTSSDFVLSIIYSKIIYYIFNKISMNKKDINK